MSNPIAVVISDLHFNLQNLKVASAALIHARDASEHLQVPLIIAGDLNDTKANLRGEVVNELIEILKFHSYPIHILVGNHDLINERGDENSLNFLSSYADVISHPADIPIWNFERDTVYMYPYTSTGLELKLAINNIPKGSIIIMHQGFLGAQMGDYIQDKSSIDPNLLKDYIVISGHYHRHQTIGPVTYVGSPYTVTFGEANDGPKGYLILNNDGTFTREILDLRKHIIKEVRFEELDYSLSKDIRPEDIVWIKIRGKYSDLKTIDKKLVANYAGISNFKLDLIPDQTEEQKILEYDKMKNEDILDALIDQTNDTEEQKKYLKEVWRETFNSSSS